MKGKIYGLPGGEIEDHAHFVVCDCEVSSENDEVEKMGKLRLENDV
jgi:hypothetical protein